MINVCINVSPETKIYFGSVYVGHFDLSEERKLKWKCFFFFISTYFIADSQRKPPCTNDERKGKLFQFLKNQFPCLYSPFTGKINETPRAIRKCTHLVEGTPPADNSFQLKWSLPRCKKGKLPCKYLLILNIISNSIAMFLFKKEFSVMVFGNSPPFRFKNESFALSYYANHGSRLFFFLGLS